MNDKFSPLTPTEFNTLAETPFYVSLLIAYSDGNVEDKEIDWAEKVSHFRVKTAHHTLRNYYQQVYDFIHANKSLIISNLPADQTEKMAFLVQKISTCNDLLAKLDDLTRERLVDSFKTMALSVAEINSGILNFFTTNPDEQKWLQLPMIKH